jgi:hypothetical protein
VLKKEHKWGISELEYLAVIWSLKIYKHYIFGRKIVVWTDHSTLISLKMKQNKLTEKLERWALKLQKYNINIRH